MHGHVWWPRRGGDRHEVTGSDRAARRAAGPVWRAGYSLPVFAGRGPKWQLRSANPFTLPALFCGFKVRVAFPVNKEYTKILKTADGSMTLLSPAPSRPRSRTCKLGRRSSRTSRDREVHHTSRRLFYRGAYGAERAPHSHASRREAVRAAHREHDAGALRFSIANGVITSLSLHGHVLVDVCAALS